MAGKRKTKQHRVNPFERVEATPETKAKLVREDWRLTLNPDQQWAAERIKAAYDVRTSEVQVKISSLNRTDPGTSPETPGEIMLQQAYVKWWREASGKGLHLTAVHGVLVDPLSIARPHPQDPSVRLIIPSEHGGAVMFGFIERALDIYLRVTGGRSDKQKALDVVEG